MLCDMNSVEYDEAMAKRRELLSEQIRRAILAAPISRYAICKQINFSEATMSRFIKRKAGLSMEVLDKVADVLGLEIIVRGAAKKG